MSLEQQFQELATRWKKETKPLSDLDLVFAHQAYREIIGFGEVILPILFQEILTRRHLWFEALQAITGENPANEEDWGDIKKMTAAWLAWDRERKHGYVKQRFQQLAAQWNRETEPESDSEIIFNNRWYRDIIAFGEPVLPYIFQELERNPDWWFEALREITQENPQSPEDAGSLDKLTAVWLAWGKEHGYLDGSTP